MERDFAETKVSHQAGIYKIMRVLIPWEASLLRGFLLSNENHLLCRWFQKAYSYE